MEANMCKVHKQRTATIFPLEIGSQKMLFGISNYRQFQ